MKVIAVNLITNVTASSANANYPVANVLDDHPKKVWKGTSSTEVLTIYLTGTTSGLAIFNTNATGVTFSIADPNAMEFETGVDWETGVEWASNLPEVTATVNLDGDSGSILIQWEETTGPLTITASFTNGNDEVIQAGVITAGKLLEFVGPNYGLTEFVEDFSIVQENSNGSVYVKKRDMVRIFDLEANVPRDSNFHDMIFSVALVVKSSPAAWVVTELNHARWLVYARFTSLPEGSHYTNNRTMMSFQLTEVL